MSDDSHEHDDPGVAPDPRALCPSCGGMGIVSQPKLTLLGGAGRTLPAPEECPQCGGRKFLPGLQPPL